MPSVPAGSDRFARAGSIPGDAQIESLRLPPHSVEAEQAVLGGLLLSNSAWDRIGDIISESDFYRADHRVLWRSITKLIEDNKPAEDLLGVEGMDETTAFALAEHAVVTRENLADLATDELMEFAIDGMDEDRAAALIMAARAGQTA